MCTPCHLIYDYKLGNVVSFMRYDLKGRTNPWLVVDTIYFHNSIIAEVD